MQSLTKIVPASRACAILIARLAFSVKTFATRPYIVSFAHSVTSALYYEYSQIYELWRCPPSSVLNLTMEQTGPNISSRMIFMSGLASTKTVGFTKYPASPCLSPPIWIRAPSAFPELIYPMTRYVSTVEDSRQT